jgi:membrane protease YdiL (CAAX protease family)
MTAPARLIGSLTSWARFLVGFLLLWGLLAAASAADSTGRWRLLILGLVIGAAALVESILYGTPPRRSLRALGLGRPGGRSLATATATGALVLLVFPLASAVTGLPIGLRFDWLWALITTFAFNGVAEELVWRGYAFRRLREGRPFWAAVWCTMPLIAITHVPIALRSGPVIGLGAMLVAAVTSLPLSYLFETGRSTVWAPAVVHTAIDSFKLFAIPPAATTTFSLLLIVVSLIVPLLCLAVPRRLLMADTKAAPAEPSASARQEA